MTLRIRKNLIVKLIFAICFLLTVALSAFAILKHDARAETEHVWTRDEVTSLAMLRQVPVSQIADWSQYDSRDYDIVTAVKDQGSTNLCWVYGSLAAMETNILRQGFSGKTNQNLDLDEREFAKASKGQWIDPLNLANTANNQRSVSDSESDRTGAISMVAQFAARGQGIFEAGESGDEPTERYSSYLLRNAVTCENKVENIKKLIAAYGGVAFAYHSGLTDFNYFYATGGKDHVSFIVGWDDNIDKSNFVNAFGKTAAHDGGWIVKNSYGTGSCINGYFYLSYDSDLFELTAFEMAPSDEYEWCYNYSDRVYDTAAYNYYTPEGDAEEAEFAAVYKAQKGDNVKEFLKGISIGVAESNVRISISIYAEVPESAVNFSDKAAFAPKSGKLVATENYIAPTTGIYTIPITNLVELKKDCYFTVSVKLYGGYIINDILAYRSGQTLTYAYDQGKWNDLSVYLPPQRRGILSIRALTVTQSESLDGDKIDISGGTITLSCDSYVYTGLAHTPEVTLKVFDKVVSSENYTVTYMNNIFFGTAIVKVDGTEEKYVGSLSTEFSIEKALAPELPDEYREIHVEKAKTLNDINLPDGWRWVDDDKELIVGEQSVYSEYIGGDRDNYLNTTVEIKLTVQSTSDDTEQPDPDGGDGEDNEKPDPDDGNDDKEPEETDPDNPDDGDGEDNKNPDNGDDEQQQPENDDNNEQTDSDDKNQSGNLYQDKDDKTVAVVVGVCCAVGGTAMIGGLIYFLIRRKRRL
ncbi:MAG: hypothetical protein J1F69_04565 [Clostridiales bacterium]|nr:hypothetical protein [Clostridiales bacterium]